MFTPWQKKSSIYKSLCKKTQQKLLLGIVQAKQLSGKSPLLFIQLLSQHHYLQCVSFYPLAWLICNGPIKKLISVKGLRLHSTFPDILSFNLLQTLWDKG